MIVRPARPTDAAGIVDIYNHYVLVSTSTLDDQTFTVETRQPWFAQFDDAGRHRLVVADDGGVAGYACSMPYRTHAAFADTVEFSVYVAPGHLGQGVGSLLYEHLIRVVRQDAVHRAVVGIALPNDASIALHEKVGFTRVGVFDEYGKKHGAHVSSLWMQLRLDTGSDSPPE